MASHLNGSDQAQEESGVPSATITACNRCRRIKLRCSRERPACSHCAKGDHDCVYESRRSKPGVKPGAIESIQRRLEKLERASEDARQNPADSGGDRALPPSAAESVLALLARELPRLIKPNPQTEDTQAEETQPQRPPKRRRTDHAPAAYPVFENHDEPPPLPSPDAIKRIVNTHFSHIHPWVPMLHQDRFRAKVEDEESLPRVQIVLHAMSLAVSRHLAVDPASPPIFEDPSWPPEHVRKWVIVTALENFSLEGLQALIIIAFNDIGNGNATRVWSLVASLSRTVEFSQLSMEHIGSQRQPICVPFSPLGLPQDWTEEEERRRVFWNVFVLDRFCSITMGWNTSLTSIDVHQRLPCDGLCWRKQKPVLTPYLGIWDKRSRGGTDTSLKSASVRRQRQTSGSSSGAGSWPQPHALYSPVSQNDEGDMSNVGAFGYCVEAIESMSMVTSYFLQQRFNPYDTAEVKSWLERFKELDLRLIHWKMFIPENWKSNGQTAATGQAAQMDPNLTLAHVTHNASTILLHQVIAYPMPHWPFQKKLPSVWSAETCCSAGVEIANITQKYLELLPKGRLITSAFAFCVYIAARMMIVHWRQEEGNSLMDEFWTLINCLDEMSQRWRGEEMSNQASPNQERVQGHDLAGKYAEKLRYLCRRCSEDENYRVCSSAYTQELDHRSPPAPQETPMPHYTSNMMHALNASPVQNTRRGSVWARGIPQTMLPIQQMAGDVPPQLSNSMPAMNQVDTTESHGQVGSGEMDMNGSMAQMNEYFMEMDRVIAFNDGSLFTGEMEYGTW